MTPRLNTAYILARFPNLTSTFIMNEIYWMRQDVIKIHIFSLKRSVSGPVHDRAKLLLPDIHYASFLSWDVIKAQFHFLRIAPITYLRALLKTFRYTYREPKMMLQSLYNFPITVLFARKAEILGIDHIHVHFILLASIAASVISELLKIPFTIHPHATGLFSRNQHAVRLQLEDASRIITISGYHRDYIANLCPKIDRNDIEVVYCGIETDRFQHTSKNNRNIPLRILSVGRLIEKKGHEYLVDACALLADRGHEFQCQIVGAGPLKQALQDRIDQRGLGNYVTLSGSRNQSQIVDLCQASDIFSLACITAKNGDQDGLPVSLMEAMACELPVVTTPIAGIPDLVMDRETGLLVNERDPVSMADALEELIADEMLSKQLGKNARQRVIDNFEIRNNVRKLAMIFRQVDGELQ